MTLHTLTTDELLSRCDNCKDPLTRELARRLAYMHKRLPKYVETSMERNRLNDLEVDGGQMRLFP